MKLERWALIAEVVGSVAIVISLVILIFEVRANTELSRVAAYAEASRDFDGNRQFYLSNPDVFDLFFSFQEGEFPDIETQPEQALKTILWLLTEFASLERAYLAYQSGVFGEDEWARVHRSECSQWGRLKQSDLYPRVSFRLTDRYVDHLNSTCTPEFVEEVLNVYEGE